MNKRKIIRAGLVFIGVVIFFSGCAGKDEIPRQISVNGEAIVYVKPDKITVHFGVFTRNTGLEKATAENNEIIVKASDVLEKFNIEKKDIQTGRLSIDINYRYSDDEIEYYNVSNNMVITLYNAEIIDKLIAALISAGVNRLQGVEFKTSELQKYRIQAREMAVKAARKKAEEMAAVLDQKVGEALSINEGSSSSYYYQPQTQNAMFSESSIYGGDSETVALGQIPVRASVSASFRLMD